MHSSKIEPGKLKVLEAVLKSAEAENMPIALIGASARDIFLVGIHNISPTRKTMDVDFAVKVKNWAHYRRLRNYLVEKMNFNEAPETNHPERLIDPYGNCLDILPFGGVEDKKEGSIVWPEDNVKMSIIGFNDAFQSAEDLKVSDGSNTLIIPVVSLPGIVLLKIIAWIDRENDIHNRRKHIKDIYTIISHYSSINSNRLITGTDSDLAEMHDNAILTGSRLLGRDLRRLCSKETETKIDSLLKRQSENKGECLFNQDLREHCRGSYAKAKELIQTLYTGFQEGNK